jgi:hypothetical protein
MTAPYIQPGMPPAPPQPPRANSYIQPGAPLQQTSKQQPPPPRTHVRDLDNPLLTTWHAHHGSEWIRADALAPAVRRLVDARERAAAIRQRLRQLVNAQANGFGLEAKAGGNAARPVTLYHVVESEKAGLEGLHRNA